MSRNWQFPTHDEHVVQKLARDLSVSPLLATVLSARGVRSRDDAQKYLTSSLTDLHEPDDLPGLPEAAERIVKAIQDNRRITIYGDYDVDGVTGTSLLWQCFKLSGANVDYYIPSRQTEGYGLNCEAIRTLHDEDPNRLVVTVDCGISNLAEAELARELGLELIVTDHHQFADELPSAEVLVHPRIPGTEYPFGELCGAGVAFKLAWGICQRLGDGKKASPKMREFLKGAVGLAALGTVADVVPLRGENRIIVRYGLGGLKELSSLGLKALLGVCGLHDNPQLQAEDIAFAVAPRINAAGRLGQARLAVELLTTDNPERATALADYLDQLNKNRRTVERRIFKQAKEIVADNPEWESAPALVLAHHDWHVGVIGIVANRVAEHFEKPCILLSINDATRIGQGSGRSFAGYNLHSGVEASSELLETFGGHQAAIGLKIASANIEQFRDEFCTHVDNNHAPTEAELALDIDAEVRLEDCTRRAVLELDLLGPFGHENRRPVFAATGVELAEPPKTMGEGDRHLSLRVRQFGSTMRAVAFGRGEWADEIANANGRLSISFAPNINRFRGRENVELQLIDWQADADSTNSNQLAETQSGIS